VAGAAVVHRQVADDADAACVRSCEQRAKRLVAAEERVDELEARRVVAMSAARREERRQVDEVRAEPVDMVEVLLDTAEVAAVELARGVAAPSFRETVPLARDGPVRSL